MYPALTAPLNDVTAIARTSEGNLEFTDQKNAVKGERIRHRANNDPTFCPVKALTRIVRRLVLAGATGKTPIYCYYNPANNEWYNIPPAFITNALRHSACLLQPITGIDPTYVSCRSLRPRSATALLCAHVEKDAVQFLGRWKSDAMLRYLRIQAATYAHHYSQRMLDHGAYTFAPQALRHNGNWLPNQALAPVVAAAAVLAHAELYDF